ncbi:MAG: histidinol-phosphate transaminase [Methylococcaceae bacterium]|nr:histidinol-phosphate transaminase [Methylococcaceae bacterium]
MQNSVTSRLFRPQILEMSAYKVADAKGFIKLDAMENPYNLPDEVAEQWLKTLKDCELNRYPDPAASELNEIIKQVNGIPDEFDVLLGNGSDEIIQLLLMALPSDASVLAPEPAFVMYKQISLSLGLNYHSVPLNADFSLNLESMLAAIEKHQPSVIFLAYPNNPTSNLFNSDDIKKIIETAEGLVIIDEAYAPFAEATFIDQLGLYENILVMRTLSKLGLAGLRLGFIAGEPSIIAELDKIRLPYNINVLTQATAHFALSHYAVFEQQTQEICQQRSLVLAALTKIDGLKVYESAANFILIKTRANQADKIFQGLKEQGILIKNLSPQGGLLADCLRVTIGTPEENQAFLEAMTILSK